MPPSIFGPIIEKVVLAIARIKTTIKPLVYGDRYFISLLIVPLKSFAFSPPRIIPIPAPRGRECVLPRF